jgi:hypothetical protein
MKKLYILGISLFLGTFANAQNINDALRFSQTELSGTSRFTAMNGAFGALGGDLSAISYNPASSAIFLNNQAGLTLRSYNTNNKSNYYGITNSEIDSDFDLNQAGAVFVFENGSKRSKWKKFAIGLNYQNQMNFDNSHFSSGTNSNSIANYFTSYANGIPQSVLQDSFFDDLSYSEQQAFLGYQAYIIDPVSNSPANTSYVSNAPYGLNYYQENGLTSTGFNGKLTFNASANYDNIVSLGLNLNSHFVDFRQNTTFYERNNFNNTTTVDRVKRLRFNNELYTYGNGFSLQVGTIIKASEVVRIGFNYQSPTWYQMNDELYQNISSVSGNNSGELPTDVVDPNTIIAYQPYNLTTAGSVSGSLALVFKKKGLISFDYIMRNNEGIKFRPEKDFAGENTYMSSVLQNAGEYRIGGEYKIKNLSLRGGYRFEESPYKNGRTIGNLTSYSGGLGYNFGNTKIDLAYNYAQRFYDYQFFNQGLTDYSTINMKNHTISLTALFEL